MYKTAMTLLVMLSMGYGSAQNNDAEQREQDTMDEFGSVTHNMLHR